MNQRANKIGGSYQAAGTIVSTFQTLAGETRHVFEFDVPKGMLHIFGPAQVEIERKAYFSPSFAAPYGAKVWDEERFRRMLKVWRDLDSVSEHLAYDRILAYIKDCQPADSVQADRESLRDKIGQALSDALARQPGEVDPDWCDAREIDRLADAVMAVLPAPQP